MTGVEAGMFSTEVAGMAFWSGVVAYLLIGGIIGLLIDGGAALWRVSPWAGRTLIAPKKLAYGFMAVMTAWLVFFFIWFGLLR